MSRHQEDAPLILLETENCELVGCSFGSGWCVQKCGKRTITMLPGNGFPLTQNRRAPPIMTFSCDGVQPIGFVSCGLWEGVTAHWTPFKDIDLKSGRFEYPAEDGEPEVVISNMEFSFRVAR